jgi:hypothetical protein
MSQWGTLEASFYGLSSFYGVEGVKENMPTGSEGGPGVHEYDDHIHVEGRLRDVDDLDAPAALAWFAKIARFCDKAYLLWEIDNGPRYRWKYENELERLKGVLDL